MAELKRNFLKAKMNKDLDERLIPEGEYKDALNVEISTSEGSNSGTAQTLMGNKKWDTTSVNKGSYNQNEDFSYISAQTVGVYKHEEKDHIYNFICGAQDLRDRSFGVAQVSNKTGFKSDRIEQIKPHPTNANLTQTKIVFEDVYEVRHAFTTPSDSNNSFIYTGKPQSVVLNCGATAKSYGGIRVGMRVNAISTTGQDIYGVENEIYVTSITKRSNNPELWDINITDVKSTNIALSQNDIDNGVVIKFTAPRILNFTKGSSQEQEVNNNNDISFTPKNSIITAINVIDDYLFFTDGRNEPKKINIKRSIDGTSRDVNNVIHTTLVVHYKNKKKIPCYAKESHVTVIKKNPLKAMKAITGFNNNSSVLAAVPIVGSYASDLPFGEFSLYTSGEVITAQTASQAATNLYMKIDSIYSNQIELNGTITLTGVTSDISVVFEVVALPSEGVDYFTLNLRGSVPDAPANTSEAWVATIDNRNDLYIDDFIRFAYRYKYVDGETSCISPYSNPAFVPNVYSYSPKKGFNLGMENKLKDITLRDYIEPNIPEDVVEVELIFKTQTTDNFYSFKTISRDLTGGIYTAFDFRDDIRVKKSFFNSQDIVIKEKLSGTTIPSDQITRTFDAVPLTAKSQEVQANRLMFGNYTLDYDLLDSSNARLTPNINSWVASIPALFDSSFASQNVMRATSSSIEAQNYTSTASSWDSNIEINTYVGNDQTPIRVSSEVADPGNNYDDTTHIYTAPLAGEYVFSANAAQVSKVYTAGAGAGELELCDTKLIILKVDDSGEPLFVAFYPSEMPQSSWSSNAVSNEIPPTTITLEQGEKLGLFAIAKKQPSDLTGPVVQNFNFTILNPVLEVLEAPSENQNLIVKQGRASIKSSRSYDVGVVYRDDFGRESTVVISEDQKFTTSKSISRFSNRIWSDIKHNAPYWAKTYKFFVKENSKKFYNLVMEAAFLSVFQDFVYLAFNNVDKDKVTTGDYLILKKKHELNNAVIDDRARYRVVSIIGESSEGVTTGDVDFPDTISASTTEAEGRFFVKIEYEQDNFGEYVADLTLADDQALGSQGSNNGAVFEVERPEPEDLDIFFEVSDTYAVRLDVEHADTHIDLGDQVCVSTVGNYENMNIDHTNKLKVTKIEGAVSNGLLQRQFDVRDAFCVITVDGSIGAAINQGVVIKIIKHDGSSVAAKLGRSIEPGDTEIWLIPEVHPVANSNEGKGLHICLPWFNCYSFGNGVESDTIRDDFNETTLWQYGANVKQIGFKASLIDLEYKRKNEKYNIIYSQIYNEAKGKLSGSNRFNEFLLASDIVKKLNPEYGSVQKLYSRNNDLIALCEDKCLRILSEKDALYNSDGSEQLLARKIVLGQAIPFKGDYGISKNPESFAVDEYRIYFTDKSRGSVLRLSMDGLTNISNIGMKDWFADAMLSSEALVGSFDSNKEEYNITLHEVLNNNNDKNVYTVSFNEAVKGWSSFKSFIQESGITLNNSYFTFKNGYFWKHSNSSALKNNFYDKQYDSTINLIFNSAVSSVKDFKTINYEGTQAKDRFNSGWDVEYVYTDLQEGKPLEFLNKEGKWFSAIKGDYTKHVNEADGGTLQDSNIDFSELSVQGLSNLTSNATLYSGDLPSQGFDLIINAIPQDTQEV